MNSHRASRVIAAFAVLSAAAACKPDEKEGTTDGLLCTETSEDLYIEEDSPLGFAGRDLTTLVSGEHLALLTYADASSTNLSLKVSYTNGQIRFVDREPADGGGTDELDTAGGGLCPDSLEVDVTLLFAADDGLFDEEWETPLVAYAADQVSFDAAFDPLDLVGDYDINTATTLPDYDTLTASASGTVDLGGTNGTLSAQAAGEDECDGGADCSAWVANIEIGSWVASD